MFPFFVYGSVLEALRDKLYIVKSLRECTFTALLKCSVWNLSSSLGFATWQRGFSSPFRTYLFYAGFVDACHSLSPSIASTLRLRDLETSLISPSRPSVHTNPSRKRSFSKTLFKPEEIWKRRLWTENISKTELFKSDAGYNSHDISRPQIYNERLLLTIFKLISPGVV